MPDDAEGSGVEPGAPDMWSDDGGVGVNESECRIAGM